MDKKKIDEFILAADNLSTAAKILSVAAVIGNDEAVQKALDRMVDAGEEYDVARGALNEYRN